MIAFAAPIEGWKDGGRPFIGFDVCHLTGKHGGCLMAATGLDGQNGIVTLAIKVVRNECGENWHLFMKELLPLIEDHPTGKITFISDRQKGLQESLDENSNYCDMFSTSHMFKSFKSHFKGSKLHYLVYNAAKCYKERHWKANIDDLIKLSPAAAAYMMKEKPEQWSRDFFDPSACCEHLNNNFSESFNKLAKTMRDKPICTLGMMYGQLVMGTMYKRRNVSANWEDGKLVPTDQDLIDEMQKCCGALKVNGSIIDKLYEVTSKTNVVFHVDVVEAFYCNKYYHVESYKAIYAPEMGLLIGREE
ncbi:uncharacterized protein LOC113349293 [Papaver somniferum]|uniref:uncharacterized protein LOC113349293 n=1 Tax=Papaver somniferum TaxID=3469 RepID=UPI000E704129|nr:uncharacterized protein LOC113349293 [Papaver somniferum]